MTPYLLLVEDDPVSRGFLAAALQALPARVDSADSLAAALAGEAAHDLWLLDAHLPDGSGSQLLAALRRRFPRTPALAHTADDSPQLRERLRADGFAGVLVKPIGAAQLQAAVRATLGHAISPGNAPVPAAAAPLWDDATALAALNDHAGNVASLRGLFLAELPAQHASVREAAQRGDRDALHRELHRLKASSGFVGALRLREAAARLDAAPSDATLAEFGAILDATLAARPAG